VDLQTEKKPSAVSYTKSKTCAYLKKHRSIIMIFDWSLKKPLFFLPKFGIAGPLIELDTFLNYFYIEYGDLWAKGYNS
jgi:hypothetical protein